MNSSTVNESLWEKRPVAPANSLNREDSEFFEAGYGFFVGEREGRGGGGCSFAVGDRWWIGARQQDGARCCDQERQQDGEDLRRGEAGSAGRAVATSAVRAAVGLIHRYRPA